MVSMQFFSKNNKRGVSYKDVKVGEFFWNKQMGMSGYDVAKSNTLKKADDSDITTQGRRKVSNIGGAQST